MCPTFVALAAGSEGAIVVLKAPTAQNKLKIGKPLMEKKELGSAYIEKIRMLTQRNNHNEARLELAKQMKLKNLVKSYEALLVLQDNLRDMNDLMGARRRLDKMLFSQAERVYSNYDIINGVF